MKNMPGEIKLLDSRQVDEYRIEVRSVLFPQEITVKATALSLLLGFPPIKKGALPFIRGVSDKTGNDFIEFADSTEEALAAMEGAYEYLLRRKAEKTKVGQVFLLLI